MSLPRLDKAWPQLQEERVIRVAYPSTFDEFRIRDITQQEDTRLLGNIEAEGIGFDLKSNSGLLERLEANGLSQLQFEVDDVTPTEHVDIILGAFAPFTIGAPSYFSRGTIEPTIRVLMIYDWTNPLAALKELAEKIGAELSITRNGVIDYRINLLNEIGSGDPSPLFMVKRNIVSIKHESSSKDQANRIYPKGGEIDGWATSMAENSFIVTAVSGNDLTLEDDVVMEADQWNPFFIAEQDGTVRAITGATVPNIITVPGHTVAVDELVQFVRDSNGSQLTYVESPSSQATYGLKGRVLDRGDISGINNFAWNGFLQDWTEGGRGTEPCIPDFNLVAPGGASACITRTAIGLAHFATFSGAEGELLNPSQPWVHRVESTGAVNDPNGVIFLNLTLGLALGRSNFGYYIQEGQRAVNTTLPGPVINLALYADEMIVEADVDNFGGVGACAVSSLVAQWQGPDNFLQAEMRFFSGTIKARIFKKVNGSFSQIGSTYDTLLGSGLCDVSRKLKFVVGPGLQELYIDGVLRVSGTDSTFDGVKGFSGFLTEDVVDSVTNRGPGFDEFRLATGPNEIVMFGLPTGWTIEACGLSPAVADANGKATLDLGGSTLGCTDVVVKDDLAAIQDTFVGSFELHPGDILFWSCDDRTPGTFAELNRIHNGHLFLDNFSSFPRNTCWRGGLLQLSGKFQHSLIGSSFGTGVMQTFDPPQDEYHYRQEQCWQRATMLIQATIQSVGSDDSEVGVGKTAMSAASHVGYVAYISDTAGGTLHLARVSHSPPAQPVRNSLGTALFTIAADTDYIIQLFLGNAIQEARLWSGGSIVASVSATDATHFTSAHVGELVHVSTVGANNSQWDDYFSHDGKDIVIQNMPAGHTARLLDVNDAILGSAVESGGIATIDTLLASVPLGVNTFRAVTVVTSLGVEVVRFQGVAHPGDIYEVR